MEVNLYTIKKNSEKIGQLVESFTSLLQKENCTEEVLKLLHSISFHSEQFFINSTLLLEKYELLSYQKHVIGQMEFVNNLTRFQERLQSGEETLAVDLHNYVKHWYEDYVQDVESELFKQEK